MRILVTLGLVAAVVFAVSKFRQRNEADLWHEVTAR
ncbi:DLW-39 family protein [Nocardia transvalensis]|nr:DLW-39 family protein [Nocardia transvalensis]